MKFTPKYTSLTHMFEIEGHNRTYLIVINMDPGRPKDIIDLAITYDDGQGKSTELSPDDDLYAAIVQLVEREMKEMGI